MKYLLWPISFAGGLMVGLAIEWSFYTLIASTTENMSGPITVVEAKMPEENKAGEAHRVTDEEFGRLINQCFLLASEGYAGMTRSLDSMMSAFLGVPPDWDLSKPLPPRPPTTDADV